MDDGSEYAFTRKETWLTGLPRFDRLLALGRQTPPEQVTLVLVAPTWRTWLTLPPTGASSRRRIRDGFLESEYPSHWLALLRSPEVAEAVRRQGWRLGFLPHPNIQPVLADLDLPDHIEPLACAENDVQALFARCSLLVTDYSSVAFDAAYLDRRIVYYQFDRARADTGAHINRPGYFDVTRDGYGPVVTDHDAAVAAVVASIEHGPTSTPEYLARIAQTFPVRDGGACARVVAAVEEMSRPGLAPTRG